MNFSYISYTTEHILIEHYFQTISNVNSTQIQPVTVSVTQVETKFEKS